MNVQRCNKIMEAVDPDAIVDLDIEGRSTVFAKRDGDALGNNISKVISTMHHAVVYTHRVDSSECSDNGVEVGASFCIAVDVDGRERSNRRVHREKRVGYKWRRVDIPLHRGMAEARAGTTSAAGREAIDAGERIVHEEGWGRL
jgi:hypothetical protein